MAIQHTFFSRLRDLGFTPSDYAHDESESMTRDNVTVYATDAGFTVIKDGETELYTGTDAEAALYAAKGSDHAEHH